MSDDLRDRTIQAVGKRRGCTPPYPCGRGAGGNGDDLPCDCEAIADREYHFDPLDPCMSCGGRDCNHDPDCYFAPHEDAPGVTP